ncbi:hypothetical protein RhiTH_009609 [Rhizoctonia solani]
MASLRKKAKYKATTGSEPQEVGHKPTKVRQGNKKKKVLQEPKAFTAQITQSLDKVMEDFKNNLQVGRRPDKKKVDSQQVMKQYSLGYAIMPFVGPGNVDGVIQPSDDPNNRHNKCKATNQHINDLSDAFLDKGIDDERSPIVITIDPSKVHGELLKKMKMVNSLMFDTKIPQFDVIQEHAKEEEQIELELLFGANKAGRLGDAEINNHISRLEELRAERIMAGGMAVLVNGHHRRKAMKQAFGGLEMQIRQAATDAAATNSYSDLEELLTPSLELLKKSNYLVHVFRHDTPTEYLTILATNNEDRPNNPPSGAEYLWELAETQEAWVNKNTRSGEWDRDEALNKFWHKRELAHGADCRQKRSEETANKSKVPASSKSNPQMSKNGLTKDAAN